MSHLRRILLTIALLFATTEALGTPVDGGNEATRPKAFSTR